MKLVSILLLFSVIFVNAGEKASDRNIDPDIFEIAETAAKLYYVEGCGICKKRGCEVPWASPFGCFAHKECFTQIQKIEAPISAILNERCADNDIKYFNQHRDLIDLVQNQITRAGFSSIKTYHDANGDQGLKKVFNNAFEKMSQ